MGSQPISWREEGVSDDKVEDVSDYKVEEVSGEYIPAKEAREVAERGGSLPIIPLPPENVLKSAFLTAIKYRTVSKALTAYDSCISELTNIKDSQSRFNEAALNELRTIEKLNDASGVHEADQALRDESLLDAKERLVQRKHVAYLDEKKREVEKHNVDIEHGILMGASGTDELTEEEQELEEHLKAKLRPARYKSVADKIRQDTNLTEEQSKMLDDLVEELTNPSA